jgi:cytosine/adenosine deaminase-related metal-dependent hydrolase
MTFMTPLVNAHTHLYSGLAPLGLPVPDPPPSRFPDILSQIWWRLDRALDERSLAAAARYYVADALAHDTAALVDHHESPSCIEGSLDVIADVCQAFGLPAIVCYGATERNGGRDEARRGLAECRRFILSNRRPLVRGMVGLHASFTVSDDTIREAGALCRDLGVPLHVHVAEDAIDMIDARGRGYAGPLERLDVLGALAPGSVLAHGVHLDAGSVRRLEAAGGWIVQNPRSNLNNHVGYPRALHATRRVALGTDGFPSDMRAEAQALEDSAAQHGDLETRGAARLDASLAIVTERFGGPPLRDAAARLPALPEVLEHAHREAQRLWARMRDVQEPTR